MRIRPTTKNIEEAMNIAESIGRLEAERDMAEKLNEAYERGFRDGAAMRRSAGPRWPRPQANRITRR